MTTDEAVTAMMLAHGPDLMEFTFDTAIMRQRYIDTHALADQAGISIVEFANRLHLYYDTGWGVPECEARRIVASHSYRHLTEYYCTTIVTYSYDDTLALRWSYVRVNHSIPAHYLTRMHRRARRVHMLTVLMAAVSIVVATILVLGVVRRYL